VVIEATLHDFMKAMDARDYDAAYAFIAVSARASFSESNVRALSDRYNHELFAGYTGLAIYEWKITRVNSQRTQADVTGETRYAGYRGDFTAQLVKEGDEWRIVSIRINVPAEKINQ
jgi:hypothetical protein